MGKIKYNVLGFDGQLNTLEYAQVGFMEKFFSSYYDANDPSKNTYLHKRHLKDVLEEQTKVSDIVYRDPNDSDKKNEDKKNYFGKTGAIFPAAIWHNIAYTPEVVNREGHLLFIDIDGVPKDQQRHVFEHADLVKARVPSLVAVCYSVSKNLHFFSYGMWTNADMYQAKQKWVSDYLIDCINSIFNFDWSKDRETNDYHQGKPTQRFPTCHTDAYKWWDEAKNVVCIMNDEQDEQEPDVKFTEDFKGTFTCVEGKSKLKIDKNFNVGNYSGNDLRWRIANIVLWYHKGDRNSASEWIKKHFVNHYEIKFGAEAYAINPLVKQWFDDEFGVMSISAIGKVKAVNSSLLDGTVVAASKTLSDYRKEVEESMAKYKNTLLVADTGLGKTTLFNNIALTMKCIILVPFNCQLELYSGFNVVRAGKEFQMRSDMTNVMIWDQFVNKTDTAMLNTYYRDFIIVVDESHQLWSDRSYRQTAVQTVELLNSFEGTKLYMTATPTMESKLFGIENTLKYRRIRKHINLQWIDSGEPDRLLKKLVKQNKKNYDHILVFSDQYAKRMWIDDIDDGFQSTLVHSEMLGYPMNKNALDVLDVRKEKLIDKVTYATKFAYSGKNFRNKGKILVIVHAKFDTDAQYIIQALGRMRNADVLDAMVVHDLGEHDYTATQRNEKIQKDLVKNVNKGGKTDEIANQMINKDDNGIYTSKDIDVMKELDEYYIKCSNRDYIIECLARTGYIDINIEQFDLGESTKDVNKVKNSFSRWMVFYVQERRQIPETDDTTNIYVREWVSEIFRLYKNIGNMKVIVDYIAERGMMDCVLMDTILSEMWSMVKCSELSQETRNMLIADEGEYHEWVREMTSKFEEKPTRRKYSDLCRKYRNILTRVNITDENVPTDKVLVGVFEAGTAEAFESQIKYKVNKNNDKKKKIKLKWIGWNLPDIEGIELKHGVAEFSSRAEAYDAVLKSVRKCSMKTFFSFLKGEHTFLNDLWKIIDID